MKKIENSIMTLTTYKWKGMWVFDDADRNLVKEPFVSGADTLLDIIAEENDKVNLTISANVFPGTTHVIDRVSKSGEGSGGGTDYIYLYKEENSKLIDHLPVWLCPALFKFFDKAPRNIYIKADVVKKSKMSKFMTDLFTFSN